MVRKRKHQQAIEGDDNGDVPDEDYPGDLSATQTREFLREGPPAKHARRVLKNWIRHTRTVKWTHPKTQRVLLFQAMRGNPLDLGVNFDSVAHWPWASGIWASKNFDVGCVLAAVYAVNPESKNVELAAIFSKTVGDETSAWSRSYAYKDLTDFLCFLDGDDGVDWAEEHFGSDWEETLNLSSGDQKVKELVAPQLELLGQALFKTSTWQPEIHYQCATDQHRAAVHTMLKLRLRDPVTGETRMPSTVLHLMPIELMFHLFYYMFFDDVATLQAQAEDAE